MFLPRLCVYLSVCVCIAALATVIGPVAQALGREPTQKHLLSLILELMRDEFHDVRLK